MRKMEVDREVEADRKKKGGGRLRVPRKNLINKFFIRKKFLIKFIMKIPTYKIYLSQFI